MKSLIWIPATLLAIGSQALAEAKLWPTTIECKFSETTIDMSAPTYMQARKKNEIPLLIEAQYSDETSASAFGKVEVKFPSTGTTGYANVLFSNRTSDGKGSPEKSLLVSFHYKIDGQFTGGFTNLQNAKDTALLVSNINMMHTPYLLQLFEYVDTLTPEQKKNRDQLEIYRKIFPNRKLVPISYDLNCSASSLPKFKIDDRF